MPASTFPVHCRAHFFSFFLVLFKSWSLGIKFKSSSLLARLFNDWAIVSLVTISAFKWNSLGAVMKAFWICDWQLSSGGFNSGRMPLITWISYILEKGTLRFPGEEFCPETRAQAPVWFLYFRSTLQKSAAPAPTAPRASALPTPADSMFPLRASHAY